MADTKEKRRPKTSVIILLPNSFTKAPTRKFIEKNSARYWEYSITLVSDDDVEAPTYNTLFDHVSTLIKSFEQPPLVVPTHDRGAVVHAALAREFPHILAPSLESEFISIHKGENYRISPEKYILSYLEVKPGSTVGQEDLTNLKLGHFPMFVKPSLGTNSDMTKKVQNLEELNNFIKVNEKGITKLDGGIYDFLSRFLDETAMAYCKPNSWIVQPYVDNKSSRLVCVDGLISGGKTQIWNFHEFVFWDNHPSVIKCLATPIKITTAARETMIDAYNFVVEGLIGKGYNNQFAALEAFVTEDGQVRMAEINGRALRMMYRSYVSLYGQTGDNIFALLQMASGLVPEAPVEQSAGFTSLGYICINDKGKATDFVDFEAARNIEEIELKVDEDSLISPSSEWGHQVALCYTSGRSLEEALEKCRKIADKIVTQKDKCLWFA